MIIGLIAAMENEISPFLDFFDITEVIEGHKNKFYTCQYGGHRLILVCSGRGKVNATVYTQQLISQFAPDILFNLGVSGGIEPNSKIGQIYVGSDYCHYDVRTKQSENTFPNKLYYHGDLQALALFLRIDSALKKGVFGTGEGFVANTDVKTRLYKQLHIQAVDMESAAIAQCCYLNDTRFIAIRGICDNADEQAIYTGEDLQEQISETIKHLFVRYLKKVSI